jgi:[ribosomal protein S18]-alanine N-acetyltransferase
MKSLARPLDIAPMELEDVDAVLRVEARCFSTTWPRNAFHNELTENKLAHYFVGRANGELIAYGGLWVILEDAHITTIAVEPSHQGVGYGERMLVKLLDEAIERAASWVTLEVRESNVAAQRLYKKYGFSVVSTRRGYYSDNDENALVMWAGSLKSPVYRNRLAQLKAGLD